MNTPERKAQQLSYKHRKRKELRLKVLEYLADHPCAVCTEDDPLVLEFDHNSDKILAVSRMVNDCMAWEAIAAEIEKCTVLCANCHRRKTHHQLGFWKHICVSSNR